MASGKPLTDREKAFIAANRTEKFPSVLARHLSLYYSSENNGSRSTRTVQEYIRKLDRTPPTPAPAPRQTRVPRAKKATVKL